MAEENGRVEDTGEEGITGGAGEVGGGSDNGEDGCSAKDGWGICDMASGQIRVKLQSIVEVGSNNQCTSFGIGPSGVGGENTFISCSHTKYRKRKPPPIQTRTIRPQTAGPFSPCVHSYWLKSLWLSSGALAGELKGPAV